MTSRRRPLFRNRHTALTVGVGLYLAGALCLWDAYEHRGKDRPFHTRIWGGLV